MKTYRSTEEIDAIKVNYLLGNAVSEKKKPKDKDLVILPPEFITREVIRLGNYITFVNGQPRDVFDEAAFEALYVELGGIDEPSPDADEPSPDAA